MPELRYAILLQKIRRKLMEEQLTFEFDTRKPIKEFKNDIQYYLEEIDSECNR